MRATDLPFQLLDQPDLFLQLIIHLLKDGGRAAIVLPDGTLFGEGVKTRIKEKLLTECNLHTIVRLPNGVFAPYTGIATNLLFFEKGKPTKKWLELIAGSKFPGLPAPDFGMFQKGKISLQDHGDPVWYKNIKIRKLK